MEYLMGIFKSYLITLPDRNDLRSAVHKRQDLGLSGEEVSFYEIIASMKEQWDRITSN
jgi:hypothetical protein